MFKFPYTNLHELNLDWILNKVKTLWEQAEENNEKADYAVETADEAKEIAEQSAQAQIADGAVTTVKIADGAVTTAKIANGEVTAEKLSSDLNNAINKERKFILIGDSYAYGYTSDEGEVGGWIDSFVNTFGLVSGTDVFLHDRYRAGLTGTPGFSSALGTRQYSTQLQWIIDNEVPANTEITDIIVLGGTNDLNQIEANIITGMDTFFNICKLNYPKANVKVGCLLGYNGPDPYGWRDNFKKVVDLYTRVINYGAHYILNSEYICADASLYGNRNDYNDYYHPDRAGYATINFYTNQLRDGNSVNIFRRESRTPFIPNPVDITGFPAQFNSIFKNDVIEVTSYTTIGSPYINLSLNSPINLTYHFGQFDIDIGKIDSNIFCANGTDALNSVQTEIIGTDMTGNVCPGIGFYYLTNDGHLKLTGILFRLTNTSVTINHIFTSKFSFLCASMDYCY